MKLGNQDEPMARNRWHARPRLVLLGASAVALVLAGCPSTSGIDGGSDAGLVDAAACSAWFSSVDTSIAPPHAPGPEQRTKLLAAGGGVRRVSGKYAATWAPAAWPRQSNRVVLVALHGTDGYPEAAWNDWFPTLEARDMAFIGVSYLEGGVYDDATVAWQRIRAALDSMGAPCGMNLTVHLTGFSRGSAQSFGVAALDRADRGPINGVLAVSGSWRPGGMMIPELRAIDADSKSMAGVRIWGWCGTADDTQGFWMCDGMTMALAWVRNHGGTAAPLYSSTGLGHGGFSSDPAAVDAGVDWLFSQPLR